MQPQHHVGELYSPVLPPAASYSAAQADQEVSLPHTGTVLHSAHTAACLTLCVSTWCSALCFVFVPHAFTFKMKSFLSRRWTRCSSGAVTQWACSGSHGSCHQMRRSRLLMMALSSDTPLRPFRPFQGHLLDYTPAVGCRPRCLCPCHLQHPLGAATPTFLGPPQGSVCVIATCCADTCHSPALRHHVLSWTASPGFVMIACCSSLRIWNLLRLCCCGWLGGLLRIILVALFLTPRPRCSRAKCGQSSRQRLRRLWLSQHPPSPLKRIL